MTTNEELRFVTLDRISEVIEDLTNDEKWIESVIEAADLPETDVNYLEVIKIIKTAAVGVYDS